MCNVLSLWSSSWWTHSDEMEALLAFAGVPLRDKDCGIVSSLDFLPVACSGQGYPVKMCDVFPWASPWLSWFQVFCSHAVVSSLWNCWGLASQQQWVNAKKPVSLTSSAGVLLYVWVSLYISAGQPVTQHLGLLPLGLHLSKSTVASSLAECSKKKSLALFNSAS